MSVKVRFLTLLTALFLTGTLANQTYAWNDRGHMIVAYLAYQKLTPASRDRVKLLLKLNPKYNDWAATLDKEAPGASPADKDMMIFMIAATWADGIKRDSTYTQDGSQGGNRPDGSPDPGRNTGYDDLFMHKYFHLPPTAARCPRFRLRMHRIALPCSGACWLPPVRTP